MSSEIINTRLLGFLTTVSIVGTIGNLIVSFVYWKKKDKQTSTFFICILAFIDLTVCSILVPMTIYCEKILFQFDNLIFCKAFYFLTTTIVPSSCLLMTAIAFDRYFCICMVSRNVMTLRRAKIIVVILLVNSVLLGILPSLGATLIPVTQSNSNETLNYSLSPKHQHNKTYMCSFDLSQKFFGVSIQLFKYFYDFVFVLSVIVITVLYVLIYKEIYTRRKIKRNRKRELMLNSIMNGTPNLGANNDDIKKEALFFHHNNNLKKQDGNNLNAEFKSENKHEELPLVCKTSNNDNNCKKLSDVEVVNKSQLKPIHKLAGLKKKKKSASKQSFLRRHSFTHSKQMISKKDIRTAFMLFVVSFLFIAFYSPSIIATYVSMLRPEAKSLKQTNFDVINELDGSLIANSKMSNVTNVFNTTIATRITTQSSVNSDPENSENVYIFYLYFSNSAINPIIYCFLNPNFRKDLIKLFFKRGFIYSRCTKISNLK